MKDTQNKSDTITTYKKKLKRRKIINTITGIIVFCGLLGCLSGISIVKVVLDKSDVVLNVQDLTSTDSSLIYDDQGNLVKTVGKESRISYSYDKMPQVVIDAFVAIEDSRYFEHPGFDIPRFTKALLENIKSLSFAQGGSTFTMQVIKNTYFAVDTIAEKSVGRKIQEIYYSLKINEIVSKEKLIEIYINKINYGSTTRGIQVASQYYFGKDCTDLTLVEAAMLAGIVNYPNDYNPYYKLDNCRKRTKTVLYQMKNHGYITEEEYNLACKVDVANLLVGSKTQKFGEGQTISNQAYIDVVLSELTDVYNIDPYTTPVKVYTALNQDVQHYCDELSRGNIYEYHDDYVNCSVVLIQNYTGLIVGLSGGRDYDGARIFNYAYDNRVNPGSTAKAIFTYPLAFEYAGLGTNTYLEDAPTKWTGSSTIIKEDHPYYGWASVQRSFTTSYNIVAVKLFRQVNAKVGIDVMKNYLSSIGIDQKVVNGLNEQYSIGEQNFLASPVQLAAAESAILSGGIYTTPHTITRIEFIDGSHEPIVADFEHTRVLSEGAAWLTSYLEQVSVNGESSADDWVVNGRLQPIKNKKYTVYGKTGTSLYDKTFAKAHGIPSGSTKDWLMIGGTNDYSFSFWMGYDTGQHVDKTTYISTKVKATRCDGKIVSGLLETAYEAFGKPQHSNNKPSSVIQIEHIKGLGNFVACPDYIDPLYRCTSYVLSNYAILEPYVTTTDSIGSLTSFNAAYSTEAKQFIVNFGPYYDPSATIPAAETYDIEYSGNTYTGLKRAFDRTWVEGVVQYNLSVRNNETGEITYYVGDQPNFVVNFDDTKIDHAVSFTITGYYAYSGVDVRSNSLSTNLLVHPSRVEPEDPEIPDEPQDPQVGETSEVTGN